MEEHWRRLRRWALGDAVPFVLPARMPIVGAAALIAFLLLSAAVVSGRTVMADDAVELGLHHYASLPLGIAMQGLTVLGYLPTVTAAVVAIAALLLRRRRRIEALLLAGVMVGEGGWDDALKLLFHRQRPHLFPHPTLHSWSFPSGHAFATICLAGAILYLIWPSLKSAARVLVGFVAVAIVFGVGMSRVYLGVHYPSDIIGGWLAGVAWLGAVSAIGRAFGRGQPATARDRSPARATRTDSPDHAGPSGLAPARAGAAGTRPEARPDAGGFPVPRGRPPSSGPA